MRRRSGNFWYAAVVAVTPADLHPQFGTPQNLHAYIKFLEEWGQRYSARYVQEKKRPAKGTVTLSNHRDEACMNPANAQAISGCQKFPSHARPRSTNCPRIFPLSISPLQKCSARCFAGSGRQSSEEATIDCITITLFGFSRIRLDLCTNTRISRSLERFSSSTALHYTIERHNFSSVTFRCAFSPAPQPSLAAVQSKVRDLHL